MTAETNSIEAVSALEGATSTKAVGNTQGGGNTTETAAKDTEGDTLGRPKQVGVGGNAGNTHQRDGAQGRG